MTEIKKRHREQVMKWATHASAGLSSKQKMTLFETAISELWGCSLGTISEITLMAVFDRVIYSTSDKYPALSSLRVQTHGVEFSDFLKLAPTLSEQDITNGFVEIISEFLCVLGKLTAEVITPFLHLRLLRVIPKLSAKTFFNWRRRCKWATPLLSSSWIFLLAQKKSWSTELFW